MTVSPQETTRRAILPPAQAKTGKWVVIFLGVVVLAGVPWLLPVRALVFRIQEIAANLGSWGFGVYFLAFVLMSLLSVPVWAMPFVAGALFGTVRGTVITSAGCVSGAAVCFLVARALRDTWLRSRLEASPRLRALEQVVEAGNWKIVAAVRLAHVLTFGMQNYAFGLTNINFRTFLITTWIVTLPGILLQVHIGDLGFTSLEAWENQSFEWQVWTLRIGGLIVMAVAVSYLSFRIRSAYRDAIESVERGAGTESTTQEFHGGGIVS